MKKLVLLLLVLGSLSVFASTGEDRASTGDGVICQAEEGKSATDTASIEEVDGNAEVQ